MSKENRLGWTDYFLGLLPPLGVRGTCDRGRSAAIIVSPENTIVTTGYVGAPSDMPHCDEVGHSFEYVLLENDRRTNMDLEIMSEDFSEHCVRTIHAEQNAIFQAAEEGKPVRGCTIYCTMFPCFRCALAIIRVKIKRVVALHDYHKADRSKEDFDRAGIVWAAINDVIDY